MNLEFEVVSPKKLILRFNFTVSSKFFISRLFLNNIESGNDRGHYPLKNLKQRLEDLWKYHNWILSTEPVVYFECGILHLVPWVLHSSGFQELYWKGTLRSISSAYSVYALPNQPFMYLSYKYCRAPCIIPSTLLLSRIEKPNDIVTPFGF